MAARCRDLQCPFGAFLALDVGQVQMLAVFFGQLGDRLGQRLAALEMIDQGQQISRRQHR
jgi:hypothetical protein